MLLSGTIFNPTNASSADGTTNAVNQGRANEMLVAELHGKYFTQCYRGNVFYSSTASGGVIIPISTTLTPTYSVWNPSGSGKLLVPITLYVGWTATTAALGNIVWTSTTAASSGLSTSSGFSAFGSSTTVNGNLGAGNASVVRVASGGTTTLVAASTVYRATGFSITATTAATSVAPGWTWRDDYDGSMIIPPGNAVHIMATTAIAITAEITLVWAEVPL